MSSVLGEAYESLLCIKQMLTVVFTDALPLQGGDNASTVGIFASRPSSVVPLVVGLVVCALYVGVVEYIGHSVAVLCGIGKGCSPRKKLLKQEKFKISFTEFIFYSMEIFIAWRLFAQQQWMSPYSWADVGDGKFVQWVEVMKDGPTGEVAGFELYTSSRELKAYCIIEFGYYASTFFKVLLRPHKGDFWEMAAHHLITGVLLSFSYYLGHLRICAVITCLHNCFDPFLHFAKLVNYLVNTKHPLHVLADVSFALCAIAFAFSRLMLFPYVIYVTALTAHWTLAERVLRMFLVCLYPIHLFWFYLILKVLNKALFAGTVQGDSRSSDEDEDEDEDKKAK